MKIYVVVLVLAVLSGGVLSKFGECFREDLSLGFILKCGSCASAKKDKNSNGVEHVVCVRCKKGFDLIKTPTQILDDNFINQNRLPKVGDYYCKSTEDQNEGKDVDFHRLLQFSSEMRKYLSGKKVSLTINEAQELSGLIVNNRISPKQQPTKEEKENTSSQNPKIVTQSKGQPKIEKEDSVLSKAQDLRNFLLKPQNEKNILQVAQDLTDIVKSITAKSRNGKPVIVEIKEAEELIKNSLHELNTAQTLEKIEKPSNLPKINTNKILGRTMKLGRRFISRKTQAY